MPLGLTATGAPTLVSPERVTAAAVLMHLYQYGIRLRFFEAIERARALMGTDVLCLADASDDVIDQLYCYPAPSYRAGPSELTDLAATVLGISSPEVDDARRDTRIQDMLGVLLDALNDVCAAQCSTSKPCAADIGRLDSAVLAVQARLSESMGGLAGVQVRDLQTRFEEVRSLLTDLADHLCVPCRPGGRPDLWSSLSVLVGDELLADGIDLFTAAETAQAWLTIFTALDGWPSGGKTLGDTLCTAAAVLRPPARRKTCLCAEPNR